jgi:hypothetical protein
VSRPQRMPPQYLALWRSKIGKSAATSGVQSLPQQDSVMKVKLCQGKNLLANYFFTQKRTPSTPTKKMKRTNGSKAALVVLETSGSKTSFAKTHVLFPAAA